MEHMVAAGRELTWEYGKYRGKGMIVFVLLIGIVAAPLSWLVRDKIMIRGNPLPEWSVLLVGCTLTIAFLLMGIAQLVGRNRPPKLIKIINGELIIPSGLVTGRQRSFPLSKTKVVVRNLVIMRQIEVFCGLKRAALSSQFFTSDQEFERLVAVLESQS